MRQTDRVIEQNWTPKRNGQTYCAPACGGRCSWTAYQRARIKARRAAARMGRGWRVNVFENLGWHWDVVSPDGSIEIGQSSYDPTFRASIDHKYWGHGKTADAALKAALVEASAALPKLEALVKQIKACQARYAR